MKPSIQPLLLGAFLSVLAPSYLGAEEIKLPHDITADVEIGFRYTTELIIASVIGLLLLLYALIRSMKNQKERQKPTPPPLTTEELLQKKIAALDSLNILDKKSLTRYYDILSETLLILLQEHGVTEKGKLLTYDELISCIEHSDHFDAERKKLLAETLHDIQAARYGDTPLPASARAKQRNLTENLMNKYLQEKKVHAETAHIDHAKQK